MSEIEEVISILFFLQFTLIVILLQIIAKEKKKRRTEIIISRITLQYFIRSNFNIKKRSLKNLKNPQNALGTFLPRTLWIQKYLQQPSTTSLNSIKRNIVSENGTSFVVSNRGLNLSFIATRLYPASSSHDDYKFHPHRVSYSKLYRFCEYDIETRTLETVRVRSRMCGKYTIIGRERRCTEEGRCIVAEKKKTSKKQEISGAESHPTRRDFRHGLSVNLTSFTPDKHDIGAKSLFCANENIILPRDRFYFI